MTIEKANKIATAQHAVKNAEFSVQFITTNIRWVAGGEQTKETKERISQYQAEIKEIENDLILLRQDLRFVRGF